MIFNRIVGWGLVVAGVAFLFINSWILARGAARWGFDETDKMLYGAAAVVVPWVIAVLPILRTSILVRGFVWSSFIIYNLITGSGGIAFVRNEVIASREHEHTLAANLTDRRKTLSAELAALPVGEPPATIESLIGIEQTKYLWQATEQCSLDQIKGPQRRAYCSNIKKLSAELETAKKREQLADDIADIDSKISSVPVTATAAADPQTDMVAGATCIFKFVGGDCFSKESVKLGLPAATPIVLEIGAATMFHFAFPLLGFVLTGAPPTRRREEDASAPFGGHLPPPGYDSSPPATTQELTAQRLLARWFFSHCAKPLASGSLPEADWYALYSEVCRQRNDKPLALAPFRRIAQTYFPQIITIDGRLIYQGLLPDMPEEFRGSSAPMIH